MLKNNHISRRKALSSLAGLAGLAAMPASLAGSAASSKTPKIEAEAPFRFCLNTSTISGQKQGLVADLQTAAKAGFDGVEVWINALQQYQSQGGNLRDLKKRIEDLGIQIENAIGFAPWIVDDNDTRMKALEQSKREMDMLAQIGCARIAAPPAGATNHPGLDLMKAAERFRALVELGVQMGVIPQLEVWGFSQNLNRLSQVLFVAAECGHPSTRILPDVYHLHKGGSDIDGLRLVSSSAIEVFHVNDYPAEPDRTAIQDKDRVYPGDGVAPLTEILQILQTPGKQIVLSLELFNRDYWQQDALTVAKTGLEKMKAAVARL